MNLRKRISKLQNENKQVALNHYSLFKLDGYNSADVMRNFWVGASMFLLVLLAVLWLAQGILTDIVSSSNPEAVKAMEQREKTQREQSRLDEAQRDEAELEEKEQYITGCKDSGKAPSDMGSRPDLWSCR